MLQHLSYHQIDFTKYDACIVQSHFPLIYATSWYLDISTAKDWDVLVLDDYQAVMPIPYARLKRSFWKKSVVQAYFAQQLGVISPNVLDPTIQSRFIEHLKRLKPVVYHLNHTQLEVAKTMALKQRNNFILDLNLPYEALFKNFTSSKRQRVRKTEKNGLTLDRISVEEFISFQSKYMPLNESKRILAKKKELMTYCLAHELGEIFAAYHNNDLVAVAFFMLYKNRIYYTQSASNDQGRKLLGTDFILNSMIKKYANTDKVLDFEGSELPGVAKFVQSFGAVNEPYPVIAV